MHKIQTTVIITDEIKEHIKSNPEIESFSSWARKKYIEEFMQLESRTQDLDKYLKQAERIKEEIKKLKEENSKLLKNISKEALLWLKSEGKKRAKKYSEEGVYKYFINQYGLYDKLNRRQFKILLDNI